MTDPCNDADFAGEAESHAVVTRLIFVWTHLQNDRQFLCKTSNLHVNTPAQ